MKVLAIIPVVMLFSLAYAETPFFANGGFTKNGIEWCEENYQLYNFMGRDFFEHHQHSIEARVCGNLYNDSIWMHTGPDRYEMLVEKSKHYTELEIEESKNEAGTGMIDTNPVNQQDIPQVITQQQIETEKQTNAKQEDTEQDAVSSEKPEIPEIPDGNGGGCLIATAAYGSELAPQVQLLREVRDGKVMQTGSGAAFMAAFNHIYYSFSPVVADYERENPVFREMVRLGITPMLASLSVLDAADIRTDSQMIGYGVGVILMNVGIYFAAPALAIVKAKNHILDHK